MALLPLSQFLELDAGTFIRFKRRSSRVVCTGPIFYSIRCGNSTRPAARAARHLRRTCPPPKPNRRAPSRVARPPRRNLKIGPVRYTFLDLLLKLIKVPASNSKNWPRTSNGTPTTRFRFFFFLKHVRASCGCTSFFVKNGGRLRKRFQTARAATRR